MLCGTPVIAYRRGAVPELVDEGVTGFMVSTREEMGQVLVGLARGEIAFDRAACRAVAERRFSRERMVADYLAVYEEALGGAAAAPRALLQ
jgi:glycosyltransferase involved in cell wall biosynthesis